MFRRSATALMPKPESEPLLFRPERIPAKPGESAVRTLSPVRSARKESRLSRGFLASSRLEVKPTDCVADGAVCSELLSAWEWSYPF